MTEMTQANSLTASQAHFLPVPSTTSVPASNSDEPDNARPLGPKTALSTLDWNAQSSEQSTGQSADAGTSAPPSAYTATLTTPTTIPTTVSSSSSYPPTQQQQRSPSSGLLAPPTAPGELTTLTSSALNSSVTLTGPLAPLSLPPSTFPSSTSLAAMINSSLGMGMGMDLQSGNEPGAEMQSLNSGLVSTMRLGPPITSPASATSATTPGSSSAPAVILEASLPVSARANSPVPAPGGSASPSASSQPQVATSTMSAPMLTSTVSPTPVTIPSLNAPTTTPQLALTLPEPPKPLVAITFLFISGKRRTMTFDPDTTIGRVKELLWSSWPSDVNEGEGTAQPPAPSYLRVLYLGKILVDEDTLSKLSFPTHIPEPNTTITPPPTIVHLSIRPSFPNNSSDDMTLKKKASRAVRRGLSRSASTAVTGTGAGGAGATLGGLGAAGDRSVTGSGTGTGRLSGGAVAGSDRRRMEDDENVTTCCSCVIG